MDRARTIARVLRILIIAAICGALAPGAAPAASSSSLFQYVSPRPGARFVPPGTTIILRPEAKPAYGLASFRTFEVVGSTSGLHLGELIAAEQGRMFIFRPSEPFEPGETVSVAVSVGPDSADQHSFDFTISATPSRVGTRLVDPCFGQTHHVTSPERSSALSSTTRGGFSLPNSFPALTVTIDDDPAPGYVFAGPHPGGSLPDQNFAVMLENTGSPAFFRCLPFPAVDFKKHPSVNLFSYFQRIPNAGFRVVDESLVFIDTFHPTNGYSVNNPHDFQILPNGHVLVGVWDPQIVDMSQIVPGGDPNAIVHGFVLQEQDPGHNVVFQWRSWDHFQITDATGIDFTAPVIDYVHWNAVEYDTDGNIMISSRHLDEITKIDRQTGNVLWRMGGSQNEFTLIGDTQWFTRQHAIRRTATGTVTLYDNGNLSTPQESRAVEYELDEVDKTATLFWEFRNDPPRYSAGTGNTQRLPNGNTMISWGGLGVISEVRADGTKAFEMFFDTYSTYRAFRFEWNGTAARPELWHLQSPHGLTLFFVKFGDDTVQEYRVYAGNAPEPTTQVGATEGNSFELDLAPKETVYVRVAAWDGVTESPYSNELELEIPAVDPVAAPGLTDLAPGTALYQSRPNPFMASTTIDYALGASGATRLAIYDLHGRRVASLMERVQTAGRHSLKWDGRDTAGRRIAPGVYFLRLESGDEVATRKVALRR